MFVSNIGTGGCEVAFMFGQYRRFAENLSVSDNRGASESLYGRVLPRWSRQQLQHDKGKQHGKNVQRINGMVKPDGE
jgi:hypothetical protein